MKGKHWFILGVLTFVGLIFLLEYSQPVRFVWTPTFERHDKQPFGCYVFDQEVDNAWPEDYYISRETFYQLSLDSTQYAVLAIARHMNLSKTDVDALVEMAEQGSKIMLVGSSFSQALAEKLHFRCGYSYFNTSQFLRYTTQSGDKETLYWVGDSARYAPRAFQFYAPLCYSFFLERDSLSESLADMRISEERALWPAGAPSIEEAADSSKESTDSIEVSSDIIEMVTDSIIPSVDSTFVSVAFRKQVGKGEIILSCTPLIFTNYGMLDGSNGTYLFRLLSGMSDLPLVRTEVYGSPEAKPQSPLRYLLSQRPLRWALYLTMAAILLFMVFTARRRQRVIPVVNEPANKNLEFVELIGTLYYQKEDHTELVCKKFTYFAEQLRRHIQVDVEDESDDDALCRRIALKTGLEEEDIRRLFRGLRPLTQGKWKATEDYMKDYINQMNEIINHL